MSRKLRPTHDQALVRPRPDIHSEIAGCKGGEIDSAVFGKVKTSDAIRYRIPCKRNTFGFVEVLELGEGTPNGQGQDKPDVKRGDIVGLDLCQVGHVLAHQHDEKYLVPWKYFLCRFSVGQSVPSPLMNWVLTQPDEESVNHLMFKNATSVVLPRGATIEGIRTNANTSSRVYLGVERVVETGPGRFVNKTFVDNGCKPGDAVLFLSTNASVDLNLLGHMRYRFTPWSEIEGVLEKDDNG